FSRRGLSVPAHHALCSTLSSPRAAQCVAFCRKKGRIQMFRGSITALVTPFRQDGSLDEKAFRAFVEWQIAEGVNGLVPVGTTGESPTLSHAEHGRVVEMCVETAAGRVPVI